MRPLLGSRYSPPAASTRRALSCTSTSASPYTVAPSTYGTPPVSRARTVVTSLGIGYGAGWPATAGTGRGRALLGGVAQAQLEGELVGDLVLHRGGGAVAARAAGDVLGAQRLGAHGGALGELVVELAARLAASLREIGARIHEAEVGARDECLRLQVLRLVLDLEAAGIAFHVVDARTGCAPPRRSRRSPRPASPSCWRRPA